jgi:hypothetical protein
MTTESLDVIHPAKDAAFRARVAKASEWTDWIVVSHTTSSGSTAHSKHADR